MPTDKSLSTAVIKVPQRQPKRPLIICAAQRTSCTALVTSSVENRPTLNSTTFFGSMQVPHVLRSLRAWGESLFALIQIAVLALLIQHYRGKTIKGIYFLALYCGFMFLLASPLTPVLVVLTLHDWNVLLVIAGRFFQAVSNFKCGHTGQLSALSVFLDFLGSLGRIFSSLQVTGLSLSSQMHALACCGSGVMLAQILMYWNKCMTNREKEGQVQKDKAE